jgi:predicted Zn-dependent protease
LYAEAGTNLQQALDLAQGAVAEMPDNASVNDTLGYILLLTNHPVLAIPQLSRSVALESKNPVYHYHLGKAYFANGELSKAKDSLSRALKLGDTFKGADDARQLLTQAGS